MVDWHPDIRADADIRLLFPAICASASASAPAGGYPSAAAGILGYPPSKGPAGRASFQPSRYKYLDDWKGVLPVDAGEDTRQLLAEKGPSAPKSAPVGGYPLALAGIRQRIAGIRQRIAGIRDGYPSTISIQHKSDPHQTKNDQDYLEDLMCSRKESTAQGASEDSIKSYSEAEEKEAPIRSESINSITKAPRDRKLNRLGVLDLATSGSRSVAQSVESCRIRKSHTRFWKQLNDTCSPEVEKHQKTDASSDRPTFDSDLRAKHDGNLTNRTELNQKKPQTNHSIPSMFTGLKKTVPTPSSADLTANQIFNPFEDGQRPLEISGASSSKGLGGMTGTGIASTLHLLRIQSEVLQRSKERKPDDLIKAKHLKFEPRKVLAPPNTSKPKSPKGGLSKRDCPPPVKEAHISDDKALRSTQQRKFQPNIFHDKSTLLKSALHTNMPSQLIPRFGLKEAQKNSGKKRIGSSSMVEVKQPFPEGLYRGSTASGKVCLDQPKKATIVSRGKHTDLTKDRAKPWDRDASSCMNQLSEMVVAGIKNKQVKIKGPAATTQLGVLNLTNKFVKEIADQSEVITDRITRCAHDTSNVYKQYHGDIKQAREQIEQDVNWMKDYYLKIHNKDT
ncbi:hypothetical protein PGT21_010361 [Puccinia graminis f. sp. tritici]|uniref:Uncharacterized protein n=1 Tax=Puccinia graminis f. sp. tritici TaxID=56615 RepID=A0A5B0MNE9_PUCGR|nr:hypothetical protein PGT21_010361 [Puccinia graminis f. sp. tritici]